MSALNYTSEGALGAFAQKYMTMKAGAAIAANNLLTLRNDGKVYPVPTTAIPVSAFNNDALFPINPLTSAATTDPSQTNTGYQYPDPANDVDNGVAVAGTDLVCFITTGNGTTISTGSRLQVYKRNVRVGHVVISANNTNQTTSKLIDLGNGTVLVVFPNPGSSEWQFMIINPATLTITFPATSATTGSVATNTYALSAALLSNGVAVIAYNNGTNICWRTITNGGSISGENIVVATSAATTTYVSVTAAGGYFVVGYTSASGASSFKRYTNAGAVVGSAVILGGDEFSGGYDAKRNKGRLWLRSDGTLVHLNTVPNPYVITVYDINNSVVATVSVPALTIFRRVFANDQLYIFRSGFSSSQYTDVTVFGADNTIKINKQLLHSSQLASNVTNSYTSEWAVGADGSMYLFYQLLTATTTWQNGIVIFDSNGTLVSHVIAINPSSSQYKPMMIALYSDCLFVGLAADGANGNGGMRFGIYYTPIQSIFGVAMESVAAGADVNVMIAGKATITPALIGSLSFNRQGSTPPGNKGVVSATSALMSGPT